jgi:hypothetical protein
VGKLFEKSALPKQIGDEVFSSVLVLNYKIY